MVSAFDETMLRRAMRVAMNGRGHVEPNPMVGCVLVKNEAVVGEGHTAPFGGAHAEPQALADCVARGNDPRGATAYVTLEPCCHTNKKTPPCAPRLIGAGVARVVFGCLDPNPDVDGNGVAMLRAAGVTVDAAPPALEAEFRQLIAPFIQRTRNGAPYLTLKWAEAANGVVAGPHGERLAISGPAANRSVHRLRGRCDAIMVGIGTVLKDDPHLLPREVDVARTPARVVLDTTLRLPVASRLVRTAADGPVLVYTSVRTRAEAVGRAAALGAAGVEIDDDIDDDSAGRLAMAELRQAWPARDWTHVLVESGPTLADSLLPLADRLWVIRSTRQFADEPSVPRAATVPLHYVETGRISLGPDTLIEYLNRDADSFAAAVRSADFVLEQDAAARR